MFMMIALLINPMLGLHASLTAASITQKPLTYGADEIYDFKTASISTIKFEMHFF